MDALDAPGSSHFRESLIRQLKEAYQGNEGRNLPKFITIAVLVAGVVGGLIIVISVILFCKYCIRKKKVLKRQRVLFCPERTVRSYKPHREYASVDTAVSPADPCSAGQYDRAASSSPPPTVLDLESVVKRAPERDDENEIDYAVAKYIEQIKDDHSGDLGARVEYESEKDIRSGHQPCQAARPEAAAVSEDALRVGSPPEGSRRVSFRRCQSLGGAASTSAAASSTLGAESPVPSTSSRKLVQSSSTTSYPYTEAEYYSRGRGPPAGWHHLTKQSSLGGMGQDYPLADTVSLDEGVSEVTPMLSPVVEEQDSPPITMRPYRTEVAVEVHRDPTNGGSSCNNGCRGDAPGGGRNCSPPIRGIPGRAVPRSRRGPRQSLSLEAAVCPQERWAPREKRRAKSYEEYRPPHPFSSAMCDISPRENYDRLEITQFNRGPFYSADYDLMSEVGDLSELGSRVRYNDMGSFEDVHDEHLGHLIVGPHVGISTGFEATDPAQPGNGSHRSRDLWSLRKTFEEDEDFSDTMRMEDMISPEDHSAEDRDQAASYTTSFESNTEAVTEGEQSSEQHSSEDTVIRKASSSLLCPGYENRRQTYRGILSKRLRRAGRSASGDNSFDSVDTIETDGDVSESSRQEFTTTSFESTTDNTDSTGDSQTHRLQKMRGDSGYKSLETQQSQQQAQLTPPRPHKKQIHFALDHESIDRDGSKSVSKITFSDEPVYTRHSVEAPETYGTRRNSKKAHFERRNGKTASKKRREYRAERQVVHIRESTHEPETDSRSDQPSGDSFDEPQSPRKQSLFSRFLRRHSAESRRQASLSRDYSVDEKTDALFNEFTRYDPHLDSKSVGAFSLTRSPPRDHSTKPRLQRKQTEPGIGRRRDRTTLSMRSASLCSDSSAGSLQRRLSPQDSIEEEFLEMESAKTWEGYRKPGADDRGSRARDIPTIKLPEDSSTDLQ